jgi:hypothetical protein
LLQHELPCSVRPCPKVVSIFRPLLSEPFWLKLGTDVLFLRVGRYP